MSTSKQEEGVHVNLPETTAVVTWSCAQSHRDLFFDLPDPRSKITLSISIDRLKPYAFLRLRVPIALNGSSSRYTLFYIFFSPHTIQDITRTYDVPERVEKTIKDDAVGLKLRLTQPPVLVVPASIPEAPLVPKNKKYRDVLKLLSSLAQATEPTIFVSTHNANSAIDASISTKWIKLAWPAAPSPSDLRRMHSGKGGRILSLAEIQAPEDNPNSPPTYDQVAPPSPPRHLREERRRTQSPSVTLNEQVKMEEKKDELQDPHAHEVPKEAEHQAAKEQNFDKMCDEIKNVVATDLNGLEPRLVAVIDQWKDGQLASKKEELLDFIDQTIKDMANTIKGKINGMA